MRLAVVSVLILHEYLLVNTVRRKRHRRNSQTGESALESVPSRERSGVSPRFAIPRISTHPSSHRIPALRFRPWVSPASLRVQQDLGVEILRAEVFGGIVVAGVHGGRFFGMLWGSCGDDKSGSGGGGSCSSEMVYPAEELDLSGGELTTASFQNNSTPKICHDN